MRQKQRKKGSWIPGSQHYTDLVYKRVIGADVVSMEVLGADVVRKGVIGASMGASPAPISPSPQSSPPHTTPSPPPSPPSSWIWAKWVFRSLWQYGIALFWYDLVLAKFTGNLSLCLTPTLFSRLWFIGNILLL